MQGAGLQGGAGRPPSGGGSWRVAGLGDHTIGGRGYRAADRDHIYIYIIMVSNSPVINKL